MEVTTEEGEALVARAALQKTLLDAIDTVVPPDHRMNKNFYVHAPYFSTARHLWSYRVSVYGVKVAEFIYNERTSQVSMIRVPTSDIEYQFDSLGLTYS